MGQTVFKHYVLVLSFFELKCVKKKIEQNRKMPKSHYSRKPSNLRNQAAALQSEAVIMENQDLPKRELSGNITPAVAFGGSLIRPG